MRSDSGKAAIYARSSKDRSDISPATQKAVARALAANDEVTLSKYARFLEAIMATLGGEEK